MQSLKLPPEITLNGLNFQTKIFLCNLKSVDEF